MKLTITKATKIAIEAAEKSVERHKMGAILFSGNKYVTACNRTFSVIVKGRQTPYSDHAESIVINRAIHAGFNLYQCTLIVVRVSNGNLLLSRPCKICKRLISNMKIPKVYFSNDPMSRLLIKENFKSL
jgi:cytidine deaminase